jgi:hypothetical protein
MTAIGELFEIADHLEAQNDRLKEEAFDKPLQLLIEAANRAGKASSGSWLGYHSRVYYSGLTEPPPGARFSQEWGLMAAFSIRDTVGDWQEYSFDEVVSAIQASCGNPDTSDQADQSSRAKEVFEESQSQVQSLLSAFRESRNNDRFLQGTCEKIDALKIFRASHLVEGVRPKGQFISSDMPAVQAGLQIPPHVDVLARVFAIRNPFTACGDLSKLTRRAASHLQTVLKKQLKTERIGTNVFIGHGRSPVWRDLKDFIQDRMRLPWDEFNRVPVAGSTNIARLSQMLDEAAIAFLIMTAEDEQADGKLHARLNVIHEAGLFQGRLGFERAILLLEEGCEPVSCFREYSPGIRARGTCR